MLLPSKAAAACAVSCLFVFPVIGIAQEITPANEIDLNKKWFFNASVETVSIDEEIAALEGIEPDAISINLDGEYYFNDSVSASVGLGFLQYDDNEEFSQLTQSVYGGDVDSSSSTALGIPLLFDVGYTRFYGNSIPTYATLRGGLTYMLESERSISNCDDCRSDNIEVDGGLHVAAGFGFNLFSSFTLGFYYKNYLSGDLEDAVGLKLAFGKVRSN
jgi:hypothetical protein